MSPLLNLRTCVLMQWEPWDMPPKHTPRHAKCHRVSLSADSNWLHDVISCPRRCPDNELAASADYERGGYINVHLFRPREPRQMLVSALSLTRALSLPPTLHPALLVLALPQSLAQAQWAPRPASEMHWKRGSIGIRQCFGTNVYGTLNE